MQDKYCGKINILHLLEGARQAKGLAVIIDVFRAFSLECYFYAAGAKLIRPVGSLDEAYLLKNRYPDCLLAGTERQAGTEHGQVAGTALCGPLCRLEYQLLYLSGGGDQPLLEPVQKQWGRVC